MAITISIGGYNATFGGAALGQTVEGSKIVITPQEVEITAEETGDEVAEIVMTGLRMQVMLISKEFSDARLGIKFPYADASPFGLDPDLPQIMTDHEAALVLSPLRSDLGLKEWTFGRAISRGPVEIMNRLKQEKQIAFTFECLRHATTGFVVLNTPA